MQCKPHRQEWDINAQSSANTRHTDEEDKRNGEESRAPMHRADIITFTFKVTNQTLLHRVLGRRNWMLFPRTTVITAQDGHFTLLAAQWGKVWHLQ